MQMKDELARTVAMTPSKRWPTRFPLFPGLRFNSCESQVGLSLVGILLQK